MSSFSTSAFRGCRASSGFIIGFQSTYWAWAWTFETEMGKFAHHCICPQQDALVHLLISAYKLKHPFTNYIGKVFCYIVSVIFVFEKLSQKWQRNILLFSFFQKKDCNSTNIYHEKAKEKKNYCVLHSSLLVGFHYESCMARVKKSFLYVCPGFTEPCCSFFLFSVKLINTYKNALKS